MTRRFGRREGKVRIDGRAPLQPTAIKTRPLIVTRDWGNYRNIARCRVLRSYFTKLGRNAACDKKGK
jgi:hypothetical protein